MKDEPLCEDNDMLHDMVETPQAADFSFLFHHVKGV